MRYAQSFHVVSHHRTVDTSTCCSLQCRPASEASNFSVPSPWILTIPKIPSGYVKIANWNMAIEIVDFPIENGDFL